LAIQADEAMLTPNSGSVSLSRSARGESVQTIWLVGRRGNPFTLDTTMLRCVIVAPLGMFLLALQQNLDLNLYRKILRNSN